MSTQRNQLDATRLVLRHRASLHGYIYTCVRNHADAEDLFQEVSLAIVKSFGELRDEAGFLPWAREIAFRRVLAHLRKSKRRERSLDPNVIGALAEASDAVDRRDPTYGRLVALRECLEELPKRSRELIQLRYADDVHSVDDLARRVGRTVQAVYSVLKRTRLSLRTCVERRVAAEGLR